MDKRQLRLRAVKPTETPIRVFRTRRFTQCVCRDGAYTITFSRPPKAKRWLNWLFLAINLAVISVIFAYQSHTDGVVDFATFFRTQNGLMLLGIALGLFFLMMLVEVCKIALLVKRTTGKWNWKLSYKISALGRYYDCLTPFSSGGQPFQIYQLHKNGLSMEAATGIPMGKFVYYLIGVCAVSIGLLVFNGILGTNLNSYVVLAAFIGIGVDLLLLALLLSFAFSKKNALRLVLKIIGVLTKLRLIKNYYKAALPALSKTYSAQ